jgi:hypothetical protein
LNVNYEYEIAAFPQIIWGRKKKTAIVGISSRKKNCPFSPVSHFCAIKNNIEESRKRKEKGKRKKEGTYVIRAYV